eukprot:jgi/Chlat1/5565/Chrsp369S05355
MEAEDQAADDEGLGGEDEGAEAGALALVPAAEASAHGDLQQAARPEASPAAVGAEAEGWTPAALLSSNPRFPTAVRWSQDNLLLVTAGAYIHILNPHNLSGPRGIITAPHQAKANDDQDAPTGPSSIGELYPLMVAPLSKSEMLLFRQAAWSPVGCAPSGGCLIAAFTTGRHIKVYRPSYPERRAEWTEVADLGADLLDYHELTAQDEAHGLSSEYVQVANAVTTQQCKASSLDINTSGVLGRVLPGYVQSASGVLHRQGALRAATKKVKKAKKAKKAKYEGRFPQVDDNVEVFSAAKGPWGCWQPAQVTKVRLRTITVQLHNTVSGADPTGMCKVSLADAKTAVPMPIKHAIRKKGPQKKAKASRAQAINMLVPHIRPLREDTQGVGQQLALQQRVEVLYEGSWWPGIVQDLKQRKEQCTVRFAGAKATVVAFGAVRPVNTVWKDARWMPIDEVLVRNEQPLTSAQKSAFEKPSTIAGPPKVGKQKDVVPRAKGVSSLQGAQGRKRKHCDEATKLSTTMAEDVFMRFAAAREEIPRNEREVYDTGQHLRKQDLTIFDEALDSVVKAYQQDMAEAALTTKEVIKLAKILIRTKITNMRGSRVVTRETLCMPATRAAGSRKRHKATQEQETPGVPLSPAATPSNLRQLARAKAKGTPPAAVSSAKVAIESASSIFGKVAKGKGKSRRESESEPAERIDTQASSLSSIPEKVAKVTGKVKGKRRSATAEGITAQANAAAIIQATDVITISSPDAIGKGRKNRAPASANREVQQQKASEDVDPMAMTTCRDSTACDAALRAPEIKVKVLQGCKTKKRMGGQQALVHSAEDMLERTAKFAAVRDLLTPMSLDWSPVVSAPMRENHDQLLNAPTSNPFVLLAVGTRAGTVVLWRMQLLEQYTLQGGGKVSGPSPFTSAGSFAAHTSWTSALCWVSEQRGVSPTHQQKQDALLLVSASATGAVRLWAVNASAAATADARASGASAVSVDLLLELCPADDMNISVLTAVQSEHEILVAADKGPGNVVTWRLGMDDSGCVQPLAMRQRALHSLHVTGLAFSSDGSVLYSTSREGTRYAWNMDDDCVVPLNDVLVNIPLPLIVPVLQTTVSATSSSPTWGLALSPQHQFIVTVMHIPRTCLTQLQRRVCHSLVQLHGVSIASINKPLDLSSSAERALHLLTAVAADPTHSPLSDVVAFLAGMSAKQARQLVCALEEPYVPICEAQLQGGGGEGSTAEVAQAWRAVQVANTLRRHFASQWIDDDDDNKDLAMVDSAGVMASVARNEHLVRQWLAGWRMRAYLQQEQKEDSSMRDAMLAAANWVDTSLAPVATPVRALAVEVQSKKSQRCDGSACWRDTCPLCKSTMTKGQDDPQADQADVLQCTSGAPSHRVSRCMACFKACFSPILWRCSCCERRSCIAPPSPALPLGWRGAAPPCCPFCGILLSQRLPQSMLAPSLM